MYLEENLNSEERISSSSSQISDERDIKPGKVSAKEKQREYQKRYYLEHKERAKAYQKQYRLTYIKKQKTKARKDKNLPPFSREPYQSAFNTADIMQAPTEKAIKMLEKIIRGERFYAGI